MKSRLWVSVLFVALLALAVFAARHAQSLVRHTAAAGTSPVVIDVRTPAEPAKPLWFPAGGTSPSGEALAVNSRYLMRNGKPWFPVMGEFQYSRYPEAEWEEEILKMKSGGIEIVSTYVFWIHHEEIKGQFDWSGQRDLRKFIELCAKHKMYVWVRIGPWDHGECRNGGFPDWLVNLCPTRQLDPVYMDRVKKFFEQIGAQLKGTMWKDGGPIIGVQVENEYSARGPGKGADYLLALRKLGIDAGMDAPFYTITGWDDAVVPSRDFIPLYSGYEEQFWSRSLAVLPPNPNYFFTPIRDDKNVGDDLHSKRPDIDALDAAYPYLTTEMGGGMELSYHRRPRIEADDIAAMDLVKLGDGVSMYGYYMFQGGVQPDGKLSTLTESQATGYLNDVPIKSYDFQAPLGEFGQMRASFRATKIFHQFLSDFGESLAPMAPYFPATMPANKNDTATPRVAARWGDGRGFIFINGYQRLHPLPERKGLQVSLETPSGAIVVPRRPVDVPGGVYSIWPVNLDLGPTTLRYATAQPLMHLREPDTYVFFAWPGVTSEFAIEDKPGVTIHVSGARVEREGGVVYISLDAAGGASDSGSSAEALPVIQVRGENGAATQILLLTREQALNAWKAKLGGKERLLISKADVYFERDVIHLRASDPAKLQVSVFPPMKSAPAGLRATGSEGVLARYEASPRPAPMQLAAKVEDEAQADDPPPLKIGNDVPLMPEESTWEKAARWKIQVPELGTQNGVMLNIRYAGDMARIYVGGKLFDDNFYNGTAWQIGLWRIPSQELSRGIELKILPLRQDSPIYLPDGARPTAFKDGQAVRLEGVDLAPGYEIKVDFGHQP
jgi:beta-galactosidase